jgi:hypothetical protein
MIDVVLHGQLGNWLFQYAAGRRLATLRGCELRLSLCDRFKLGRDGVLWVSTVLERLPLRARVTALPPRAWLRMKVLGRDRAPRFYREPRYGFNEELLALEDGACLSGFFQSERYFRDIAESIRKEVAPPPLTTVDGRTFEERILRATAVSVHVRRDDYVSVGWNILSPDYYARAMSYVRARVAGPEFFVFSDDLAWCRAHLARPGVQFVDVAGSRADPLLDLRLMAACRHHIIANSSYSWWGAWLATAPDKIVVAPSVWLPHLAEDPRFLDEVLCPEWHRLSIHGDGVNGGSR